MKSFVLMAVLLITSLVASEALARAGCPLPNEEFKCRNSRTVYRIDACNVRGQIAGLYSCSVTATCRFDPTGRKATAWDFHFTGSMECCDFLYDKHKHFTEEIPENFKSTYCR